MKVADLFPTRFIAAADLNGKSFTLTIRSVTLEDMQSHDNKTVTKPVAWFSNAAKGLVLNRTNCMIIADLHGPETDAWTGKQIVIYATKVRAFGKMEDAIRVREELPPGPKPPTTPVEVPADFDFDGTDSLDDTIDPDTGEIVSADKSLWEPNAPVTSKPNRLSPAQMTDAMQEEPPLDDENDLLDVEEGDSPRVDPETGEIVDGKAADNPFEDVSFEKQKPSVLSDAQLQELNIVGREFYKKEWDTVRHTLVEAVSKGAITSATELTPKEADKLIKGIQKKAAEAANAQEPIATVA